MISHNEEFVGALCPEQWHVDNGRLTSKGHLAVNLDRFDDGNSSSVPGSPRLGGSGVTSSVVSTAGNSPSSSAVPSAVQSDAENGDAPLKFKAKKKKKMTRAQVKEREVRRRLRYIEWLNSPKGTPKPVDTDDEAE